MTVLRSPLYSPLRSPLRSPLTRLKGGGGGPAAVFALAGQSNMVGAAAFDSGAGYPEGTLQWGRLGADDGTLVAVVAPDPLQHWDVDPEGLYPNAGTAGLAIQFAIDFYASTGRLCVFVPCGRGNTGFGSNQWGVDATLYTDLVTRTNACMAALATAEIDARFEGILWHQGEHSAPANAPATHRQNMIDTFTSWREDITAATDNTPIVIGGLLPELVTASGYSATQDMLAGFPEYLAYTAFASSESLTDAVENDGIHFGAASLRTLGSRYRSAWVAAKSNVPEAPSVVLSLDGTPDDTAMSLAWSVPADIGGRPITDYVVRYRETGDTDWITFSDGTSTTTSAIVTGLTNDVSYDFAVSAVNAAGEGPAATTTKTPVASVTSLEILAYDTDYFYDGSTYSTFTFSAQTVAAGTALVAVHTSNTSFPSAVSVGGQSATQVGSTVAVGNFQQQFWIAEGVEGVSADVVLTMNGSSAKTAIIAVWSLPGTVVAADATLYSDVAAGSSNTRTISGGVDVVEGAAILAFVEGYRDAAFPTSASHTWTGATRRTDRVTFNAGGSDLYYGTADFIATADEADKALSVALGATYTGSCLLACVVAP